MSIWTAVASTERALAGSICSERTGRAIWLGNKARARCEVLTGSGSVGWLFPAEQKPLSGLAGDVDGLDWAFGHCSEK